MTLELGVPSFFRILADWRRTTKKVMSIVSGRFENNLPGSE